MGPTGRGTRMWSRRQHGSDDGRWIGLTPLGHGRERLQRSSGSIEKSSTYPSRSSRLGTRYTPRNQRSCLNFDMRFPNPSRKVDVYVCITVCTVLAATACKTKIKNQKLQSIWIYLQRGPSALVGDRGTTCLLCYESRCNVRQIMHAIS